MARPTASRLRRLVAGTLLLALLALAVPGCSGGGGGAVQTLLEQAAAAAVFRGYFAGISVLGDGQMLFSAAGDLNGDGLPDLVYTSAGPVSGGTSLGVQLAVGPGEFGEPAFVSPPDGTQPYDIALGDFDEDGFPDIATTDGRGSGVLLFLNGGDGTFGAASTSPLGGGAVGLVAGDFDEDGNLDLAAVVPGTNVVAVLLGNGDGTFGAATPFGTGLAGSILLETADLTGDGNLDLAVTDQSSTTVAILEGDGTGGFDGDVGKVTFPGSSGPGGGADLLDLVRRLSGPREGLNLLTNVDMPGSTVGIVLEDFNGDSAVDVAVALLELVQGSQAEPFGGVGVALNQGGGTFGDGVLVPVSGGANIGLASGDFDDDGQRDLAVTCGGTNQVAVLRGDGAGGFEEIGAHDVGVAPAFGLVSADMDLDGREDLVATNLIFSSMTLLRGLGDGDFQSTPGYDLGNDSQLNGIAAGDVDGDGLDDLVVGAFETPDLAVFLNEGDGTFADPAHLDPGDTMIDLELGDMTGDGFPDVVASDLEGQALHVFPNDGQGGFGAGQAFPVGADPFRLALADFDRDGSLDVAVTLLDGAGVAVFPGNGDGTLDPPGTFATVGRAFYPAVGDFDGDGFPDLAVGGADGPQVAGEPAPETDQVAVLLNDGSGGFGPPDVLTAAFTVQAVASADFTGDGLPDLAAAGFDGTDGLVGELTLYPNQGDGTFGAGQGVAQGGLIPVEMFAGDLNGDGFQDLAILDYYLGSYVIANGDGEGGFPTATGWCAGGAPTRGAVGHFNGDGLPDLAACNRPQSLVSGQAVPRLHVLNTVFR